jgi:cysteinyl-tRNA synthetase
LKIFNTLTRRLEQFAPLDPGRVRLYTCGPTVYNMAHIGNFRAYLFEDLLRRQLEYRGFKVFQVMNLTDVDDKTIKGARQAGVTLAQFTQPFKDAFFEDLRTLNIEPAEKYPAATEHIPEMIALIEALFKAGVAYRAADGSVYFSIAKFPGYGKLAHLDLAGLQPGARVNQDEYQKDNLADFALWKAWCEEDGAVGWDSPWGRGRPGWHLECSAMSMKYLGPTFDLHTGGVDNIFPHHEDEIAQSEAATGQPFVKYWMHCAHLVVDGRKMSKSLGNFFTLRDLLQRGYAGREVRYALLSGQYRQVLNFSLAALDAARAALQRLDEFQDRLAKLAGGPAPAGGAETGADWINRSRLDFENAMDDDLNAPIAMAALFELVREGNKRLDARELSAAEAARVLTTLEDLDRVFGFLKSETARPDAEITRLAAERQAARQARNWAEADRLRRLLESRGWIVQDTPGGFQLKRLR